MPTSPKGAFGAPRVNGKRPYPERSGRGGYDATFQTYQRNPGKGGSIKGKGRGGLHAQRPNPISTNPYTKPRSGVATPQSARSANRIYRTIIKIWMQSYIIIICCAVPGQISRESTFDPVLGDLTKKSQEELMLMLEDPSINNSQREKIGRLLG